MVRTIEPMHARPRPPDQLDKPFAGGWPEFIHHDPATHRHLGRVRELFGDLELVVLDDGEPVAGGWAVPLRWDGTVEDLPSGYNDSLARALRDHDSGATVDTLVILAAQVRSDVRGRGLAGVVLTALRDLAGRVGCARVICPVRPTLKARYPLTPVERFLTWTRPDGQPLDPWLRTHVRLGARVLAPAPRSQVITGTVGEWETWTGMVFPETGDYVVPDGLSPLHVDVEADRGVYVAERVATAPLGPRPAEVAAVPGEPRRTR